MEYIITESQAGCIIKGGGCKTYKILVHKVDIELIFEIVEWCKENFAVGTFGVSPSHYYNDKMKCLSYEYSHLRGHCEATVEIYNDQPENIMAFKLRWC